MFIINKVITNMDLFYYFSSVEQTNKTIVSS